MPTVKRFNRCRITMYFNDEPPPHFHVITRSNERISVLIETLAVQRGKAKPGDTSEAFKWAREHRGELRARWRQYSEEER